MPDIEALGRLFLLADGWTQTESISSQKTIWSNSACSVTVSKTSDNNLSFYITGQLKHAFLHIVASYLGEVCIQLSKNNAIVSSMKGKYSPSQIHTLLKFNFEELLADQNQKQ